MNLDDIYRVPLPRKKRKRIGRGPGSGQGKTAGKGHKGASSRSGWGGLQFYEGGQMPLFRRIPRRGFTNGRFRVGYSVVNLHKLEKLFESGDKVDRDALIAKGLITAQDEAIKILADGDLTKKLTVIADKFSAKAEEKIKAAGGECKVKSTKALLRKERRARGKAKDEGQDAS